MNESVKNNPLANLNDQLASDAIEQLSSVFAAYNETTDRMRQSYGNLQAEVGRLRAELHQKNELLERKKRLAALGEMAAGVAHEIRNPLGGMQLYASLLERDLKDLPKQRKWAEKINKIIQSLDLIVNDILAFTHDQVCDKRLVRIAALVQEVVDYLQPQMNDHHVTVNIGDIDPDLQACVDINMAERILANLILNAIEAAGPSGAVNVRANPCNHADYRFKIEITDTGPGIDPDVLPRIFNPFFTTKDSGTGLGLAIVHRLVECHGGIITAENQKGAGARFTVMLP